jgi:hypothetical protein
VKELRLEHTSGQLRLSIHLSEVSLKAVLPHDGNKFPSIPLVHAVHVKGTFEKLQVLLQKKKYTVKSIGGIFVG